MRELIGPAIVVVSALAIIGTVAWVTRPRDLWRRGS